MILTVALSPSLDVTYVVDALSGIQRPLDVRRAAGGKALNAARAAATMGASVAAVAVLAGPTGAEVAAGARSAGVELTEVPGVVATRTCISILARDTGDLTEIYEEPTPVPRQAFETVLHELASAADRGTGWCMISGGLPTSLGTDALARVLERLRAVGVRAAVDSHGPALAAAMSQRPDLVKVNRSEAAELLGVDADGDLLAMVRGLVALTDGVVVVTDGVDGAVAAAGGEAYRASLRGPIGSFPVGSGDTFLGGLVTGLDRGESLPDALRRATAFATANALVPGTAAFDVSTAEELMREVEITLLALPTPARSLGQ
ncbi:1-phosphofructokinase family hexose kinase [Paraoerskovia sediminicola]|uniref:1-phosphofructokinase family hexose kinase n=1 Tax=Paraoerskovia sediminicola TaxID=1138587 RepID=UPI00257361CE|nr:PfkB family carbohydrate kinase [Paraoerskovia sediminicola]